MNKTTWIIFSGITGIGIGFFAGWAIQKKQSKKIIESLKNSKDKELDSVIAAFTKQKVQAEKTSEAVEKLKESMASVQKEENTEEWTTSYAKVISQYQGTEEEVETIKDYEKAPSYVITRDEYGALDNYETACATFFSDGRLIRDEGDEIDDPRDILDDYALSELTENDVVYVRNDRLMEDFEIIYEPSPYEE